METQMPMDSAMDLLMAKLTDLHLAILMPKEID